MIKLFWNTHNQIKPGSSDPNREDVFDHNLGNYHKVSSDKWIFFLLNKIKYKTITNIDEVEQNDILIIIDSSVEKKRDLYLKLRFLCSKLFLFHLVVLGISLLRLLNRSKIVKCIASKPRI